jgi:Xaa-Pro aminopeptidase
MSGLVATMADMGLAGKVAADTDGYPWVYGYEGPTLSDVSAATIVPIARVIEAQMMVKSEAEIDLLRESTVWGNLAHVLLQRYTRVGETETEVTDRATAEATRAMTDALGSLYQSQSLLGDGALLCIVARLAETAPSPCPGWQPHVPAGRCPGHWRVGANVGLHLGTRANDDHGSSSDEQRRLFEFMVGAQDTAMNAMQPGHTCSDVDRAVRSYYEEHDLMPSWRHHTGHGLGIRNHNPPFLDIGDHTPLRPGMVFSVEPGLYVTEYGGFRHSDTVLITEDGNEMLTYYPRDIESLTIPV